MEIMQNIHIIIAAVLLVLADVAAIIKAVDVIVKRAKQVKNATAEEKAAAKEAVKNNLVQIIFGLVTDAEKELGASTGKLKSSKVAGWIYDKIPDELKALFTPEEIQDMIESGLAAAKEYWNANSKAREYIDSGTASLLTAEIEATAPAAGVAVDEIVKAVGDRIGEAIVKAAELPQNDAKPADDKILADAPCDATAATEDAADGENAQA